MSLAGPTAQRKYNKRSVRNYHGTEDFKWAVNQASYVCGGSTRSIEAFLKWVQIQTEELIDSRWASVELVAKALLDRKTLTGDEIREVIEAPRRIPPHEWATKSRVEQRD